MHIGYFCSICILGSPTMFLSPYKYKKNLRDQKKAKTKGSIRK